MNRVNLLPPHVADLIAAGEVVERPASVVKELMENAIDAGAKNISVEIQRGGMSYIRVTDNGCGMSQADASTAFLRHATSKLQDEYGLEAIKTLGFRGEALAAIAAVSRVQLLTREKDALEGTSLSLEGGIETEKDTAGCPEGTTIIVRDIFFNTPARLKFMKKDTAEGASVSSAVIRCALSHPEVSIRYIKDGAEEFQTPGDGNVESCIYTLLGREFAKTMLKAESSGEGICVSGYVSSPAAAKGNRSSQFFYVNGRFIKSQLLQTALEQAFRNSLFTGRYPACVLYLDIRHSTIDVNVHPAKTEIKFMQERPVFDAVYRAVLSALSGEDTAPELKISGNVTEAVRPNESDNINAAAAPDKPALGTKSYDTDNKEKTDKPSDMPEIVEQLVFRQPLVTYRDKWAERVPEPDEIPNVAEPAAVNIKTSAQPCPEYRIVGEAFNSYIIVESGSEVIFIDKHAAHERLLFDKLKSEEHETMSQQLLSPVIAEPGHEDTELLLSNIPLLDSLGFEIDDFGGGALMLRRLPADIDTSDASAVLSEICEAIRTGSRPGGLNKEDEILATVACKAAVKAGKGSDPLEWKPIVEAVLSGKVKYCPHGRPVTMRLTKHQLDRNFKRE
jgi:DNA mismatch repair protein MutL